MNIYPKFTQTHIKEVKLHVNAYMPVDLKFLRELLNNSNSTCPAYVKHHFLWDYLCPWYGTIYSSRNIKTR